MAAAAAWFRRLSSDHQQDHSNGPRRQSLYTPNPHGSPRNGCPPTRRVGGYRTPLNFISGLYTSSLRRFSLPSSGMSSRNGSMSSVSCVSAYESGENDHPLRDNANKNGSLPNLIERTPDFVKSPRGNFAMNVPDNARRVTVVDRPGQDKVHFTGLKGKAKKTPRKLVSFNIFKT
uniref:Uncharacterized protein n=1 Tax=Panagrolaimus sp. ES5 TaxID=591445 RepID=A0AC34F626_9BILA